MPSQQQAPHALTQADLSAWLDGLVPYVIAHGDIAGAVVVVVKDGHVLFEKGYGYADVKAQRPVDPRTTLFRPGSISKLFTWTAIMQLAEQGKLDLDKDVNAYLDFRIPPAFDKPITLRNLMTHTAGFEEAIKNLFADDPKYKIPLGDDLKAWIPDRIFPPGKVSAYSNYGAGLAGYIVQRVSGERFEQYIERHIFAPLGMRHATFEQPLPKALMAGMSNGYFLGSGDPHPFEIISLAPAGALSATGDDIARFMIAHLNDGAMGTARILKARTAQRMHAPAFHPDRSLPAMSLGFYHEDRNGHAIIGHAGDTIYFHSDLHLILDENVGIFFSANSGGKAGTGLRLALFNGFMDRYYPGHLAKLPPAVKSAAADGKRVAGYWRTSRRSESNFAKIAALASQSHVEVNADDTISVDEFVDPNGNPKKWREIASMRWRELHGDREIVAHLKNGVPVELVTSQWPPVFVLQRPPWWASASWNVPLAIAMFVMLALTVIFWPVKAMLRWRYGRPWELSAGAAVTYRLARMASIVELAVLSGWMVLLVYGEEHIDFLSDRSDWLLVLLQIGGACGILLAVAPLWAFVQNVRDGRRPWWTKVTDLLLALACLAYVWFALSLKLVGFNLNY
jgi:CubicO group peptidase (beta-lactamase class C family)